MSLSLYQESCIFWDIWWIIGWITYFGSKVKHGYNPASKCMFKVTIKALEQGVKYVQS